MANNIELSDIISFHPALLYKQDLFELEKLILDSHTHRYDTLNIKLTYKERNFEATSVEDLFKFEGLPESTDKLSISRTGWIEEDGENKINRGISLTLHHNYINCQIHSYDEDWYKGKLSRIREFFKTKKPWYTLLNRISPVFPTLALASLFYSINLIKNGKLMLSIAPSCLFILLSIISIFSFQQKIFPFVRVVLREKKGISFGLNELQAAIVIVASLFTIFQIIYTLLIS